MKSKLLKYIYSIVFLMIISNTSVFSQINSLGNTYIFSGNEICVNGVPFNFQNNGAGSLSGLVGTDRVTIQGCLSFANNATFTGAGNNAYVDGYVKTYNSGSFVFPIGDNGSYRPAAVSAASVANPANAAYFGVNPSVAITSSLKGGNETVLPSDGPFNSGSLDALLKTVSTTEYWDINGSTAAKITLSWNTTSNILTLTENDMNKLTIVGWNGTKWISIASTFDPTSLFGGVSSFSSGSITTKAAISPNMYSVYTLGALFVPTATNDVHSETYLDAYFSKEKEGIQVINNSQEKGVVQLFDVSGKMILVQNIQPLENEVIKTRLMLGVYLLKMHAGIYNRTLKLIIK